MTKWIAVVPSPAFPVKHMTDLSGQGIGVEDERDREGSQSRNDDTAEARFLHYLISLISIDLRH
jgi:hypothetical protein